MGDEFASEPVAEKVYQINKNPVRPPPTAGKGDDGDDESGGDVSDTSEAALRPRACRNWAGPCAAAWDVQGWGTASA